MTSRMPRKFSALALRFCPLIALWLALGPPAFSADTTKQHFDLPADTAENSIKRFSHQTGLEVLYATEVTRGIRTRQVEGDMSPREALDAILTGTGLVVAQDNSTGAFSVRKEANDPNVQRVALETGSHPSRESDPPDARSGGEDQVVTLGQFNVSADATGYGSSEATGVSRLKTPVQEIPQTVNVVTSAFLTDTQATDLGDAFRYVPNVNSRTENHQGVELLIRGFNNTAAYVDGFHITSTNQAGPLVDMVGVDHIEVIKGPASATFGRGEPGGAVDYVMKAPLSTTQANATLTIGSYQFYRVETDNTGPIDKANTMYYRLITAFQEGNNWEPFTHTRKRILMPRFHWDLSKTTQIDVASEYGYIKGPQDSGVVYLTSLFPSNPRGLPNKLSSIYFNSGEPFDKREDEFWYVRVSLEHLFSEHISLRQQVRMSDLHEHVIWPLVGSGVGLASNGDILFQRVYRQDWESDLTFAAQADLVLKYNLLFGHYQTLIGYEYTHEFPTQFYQLIGSLAPLDYEHPVYGAAPTGIVVDPAGTFNRWSETLGVFAEQQLSYFKDRVKLVIGARADEGKSVTVHPFPTNGAPTAGTTLPYGTPTLSARYGVTITPIPQISFYAVQSHDNEKPFTTFEYNGLPAGDPRAALTLSGAAVALLDEYGVKGELLGGRLSFSACHFRITQNDAVLALNQIDPVTLRAYNLEYLSNGLLSRGIELQAFGQITNQLDLVASFAKTRVTNNVSQGLVYVPGIPDDEFNAFIKFRFNATGRDGFSIRAGYIRIGGMYGQALDYFKFAPQEKGDVGASYVKGRFKFDLEINNVTNVEFVQVATSTNVNVSPPRMVFASVRVNY